MVVSGEMNLLCVLIQDPLFFFFFDLRQIWGKKKKVTQVVFVECPLLCAVVLFF